MCGICGKVDPAGVERASIQHMLNSIRHRGPDDEGIYANRTIGLGCRRLSIIDLDLGHQPISNEDGNVWIVFNGEIYNHPKLRRELKKAGHQFRTQTDTEVIIHLYEEYGMECVKHLRGMFAFAIWDEAAERLFLARDPLGQKPLYYRLEAEAFSFASEIKALLGDQSGSPRLNLRALDHYISLRYVPRDETLFEGTYKLPAASTLTLDAEGLLVRSYWDLRFVPKLDADDTEIIDRLEQLLLETIESHLISDVPIGAFLSGGMDSSLVAAMMSRMSSEPIATFSVGVREQDFDELPYARLVAESFATKHREVIVGPAIIGNLPEMVWHMEEPVDPYAFGMHAASGLASQDVKVVLSGDGGDELFAGYDRYLGNRLVDLYCVVPRGIRRHLLQPLFERLPDTYGYNTRVRRLRWLASMSETSKGERYAHSAAFLRFGDIHKQRLYTPRMAGELNGSTPADDLMRFYSADNASESLDRMLYADIKTRLADHLLMVVDRMTMAHSLEGRSPYVDSELAEFIATIPTNLKIKRTKLRHIQRLVGERYLPSEITNRKKRGFSFPLAYWFRGDLREVLGRWLLNSRLVQEGYFNKQAIAELIEEHVHGGVDHNYRLWLLLNLEVWSQIFLDGASIDDINVLDEPLNQAWQDV